MPNPEEVNGIVLPDIDTNWQRAPPRLPSARVLHWNLTLTRSELPFKVDVVDWATTRDPFREIIKISAKLLPLRRPCYTPS